MIITVFGANAPTQEEYERAYELGKKIALAEHTVKNGGYSGIMEAVSKGARENGGKVIGVCIKEWKNPNKYLTEVINASSINERVEELMDADYIIALEGMVGTLEEIFRAWIDFFMKNKGKLYLVGEKNRKLVDFLKKEGFTTEEYLQFVEVVDSIDNLEFLK
jgi:uncharacterized protein (TIGR00725 family)